MRNYAPIQLDIPYRKIPPMADCQYARITWEEHMKIYSHYMDSQSAERIADRGGFGIMEAMKYYGWDNPIVEFSRDRVKWQKIMFRLRDDGMLYWELLREQTPGME